MRNTLSSPKRSILSTTILVSVSLVHGIAIAGILTSQAGQIIQEPKALIQATLLPGLPSLSPAPDVEKPTQKRELKPKAALSKPKPQPSPIAAPVTTKVADNTAQTVSSPHVEEEAHEADDSDAGGGTLGSDAPITEASSNYLKNPAFAYPPLSRRLGEQGRGQIRVLVDKEGAVKDTQLIKSSGFKRLDQSAQDAIRAWTFTPARKGNETIEAWVIVPFAFILEG